MFEPIQVNLFLIPTLPSDILKTKGGDPSKIIQDINNNIFKYLHGEINTTSIYLKFSDMMNKKKIFSVLLISIKVVLQQYSVLIYYLIIHY